MSWEGDAPAEPKMAAIGDWRLATAASEVVKCRKLLGCAGTLPSRKTIRHSPLTIRHSPFATRHSLFAIRHLLPFPIALLRFSASPLLPFTLPLLPTFTPSPLLPSLLSASPP
jgi:hypothetical protein